jgi:polysaccharide biosynthesis protein PslH
LAAMSRALLTGQSASVSACYSGPLKRYVNQILASRPIKSIFAFSGQMAQFVPRASGHRFVMDFVDMDSAKFEAFGGFANAQEAKRLFAFEQETAKRANVSLFVSDAEAALFRGKTGLSTIRTLENGIDLDAFDPTCPRAIVPVSNRPLIVFTGQMDYRPNADAVISFARNVMPLISKEEPSAHFAIVGRNPTADVKALVGVTVTGEVADPRDWLAAADVVVAPLALARGVQNKVLEAMAMAKPVVASPAAAEGIDAVELIIADSARDQAEAVLSLLRNPAAAAKLGQAARERMIARYSWEARLADLPEIIGMAA